MDLEKRDYIMKPEQATRQNNSSEARKKVAIEPPLYIFKFGLSYCAGIQRTSPISIKLMLLIPLALAID